MDQPRTPWADRLFFVLVLGAGIFALIMHYGIARTDLSRKEWAVPSRYIASQFKPGDAIVILPSWALKGAEQLRWAFNRTKRWKRKPIPVLMYENPSREDFSRYKRLWVLHAPYLGKWWFARSFTRELKGLRRRFWRANFKKFGQLEVSLLRLPAPMKLVYDFSTLKNLRTAEVRLVQPPTRRRGRCPRAPVGRVTLLKRWRQRPGWFQGRRRYFFGRIIQEVGDTPRDCLHAMPLKCRTLRVRYPNVPLQGKMKLEHGFGTHAPGGIAPALRPGGDRVEISVWVEQKKVGAFTLAKERLWKTHWIDFSRLGLKQKRGSVEFRIQTPYRRRKRPGYCFRAQLEPILSKKGGVAKTSASKAPVRRAATAKKAVVVARPVVRRKSTVVPVVRVPALKRPTPLRSLPVLKRTMAPVLRKVAPVRRPAPASRPVKSTSTTRPASQPQNR